MLRFGLLMALAFSSGLVAGAPPDSAYAPLRLYQGSWQVTRKSAGTAKPERLTNDCAKVGNFYVCQQTVNGTPEALLIFVPAGQPGQYFTQSVGQDGRGRGRGNLEITGNRWTYSSTWDQGGKTTYYRNVNLFTGRNHIHYEQFESSNGRDWKVTDSGDEDRALKATR